MDRARGSSAATLNSALNPALNSTLVLWCYSTENSTELSRSMSQILSKNDDFFKNLGEKNVNFSNFDKKWWFFKILAKIDDFQVLPKILKNHQFLPKFWKITIFFINIWKFNIFCQNFEKKSSFFAKIWDMLLISSVLFSVFSAPQHYTALVSWCCSAVFSVVLDPLSDSQKTRKANSVKPYTFPLES